MVLVKTLTGTRGSGLVRKNVSKIIRFKIACEQALPSRMGRKESGNRKVGVGEGKKAGREGEGESLLTKDCSRHSTPV